jgi:hypothetical protein
MPREIRIKDRFLVVDKILEEESYALELTVNEYRRASERYEPFHSAHEGWAVLKEEVDELWEEVKKSPKKRDMDKMRAEAVQCAAMSIRFIIDCCNGG